MLTSGRFRLSHGTHLQHLQENLVVLCTPVYQAHNLRKTQDSQRLLHAKSFCFQWSSGYRMPSEPNQSGSGEWLLRMWLQAVAGAVPCCLCQRESPQTTHNQLLPASPPTTVPQNKLMSNLVSSIQTKQSPVLPLGRRGIVLRCFLQGRGRIKERE